MRRYIPNVEYFFAGTCLPSPNFRSSRGGLAGLACLLGLWLNVLDARAGDDLSRSHWYRERLKGH